MVPLIFDMSLHCIKAAQLLHGFSWMVTVIHSRGGRWTESPRRPSRSPLIRLLSSLPLALISNDLEWREPWAPWGRGPGRSSESMRLQTMRPCPRHHVNGRNWGGERCACSLVKIQAPSPIMIEKMRSAGEMGKAQPTWKCAKLAFLSITSLHDFSSICNWQFYSFNYARYSQGQRGQRVSRSVDSWQSRDGNCNAERSRTTKQLVYRGCKHNLHV